MVFTIEEKTYNVECYLRTGEKVDGIWKYSIENTIIEFKNKFPSVAFDYNNFVTLNYSVNSFREFGNVERKEGGSCPQKGENISIVYQIVTETPITSIRKKSEESTNLSYSTCQRNLKEDL